MHFVAISAKIHFNVLFQKEKFRLFHFISDRGEVDAHVVVGKTLVVSNKVSRNFSSPLWNRELLTLRCRSNAAQDEILIIPFARSTFLYLRPLQAACRSAGSPVAAINWPGSRCVLGDVEGGTWGRVARFWH